MKKRLITGSIYILILIGFFFLKQYVSNYCFDLLIYLFSVIGTYEMVRACGPFSLKKEQETNNKLITFPQQVVVLLFSIFFTPAFVLGIQYNIAYIAVAIVFILFILFLTVLLVFYHEQTNIENTGVAFLCGIYPTVLLGTLLFINHFEFDSMLALLLIFVVAPCADSMAYVFGCLLGKKFPKKMAPDISPKKTVIGGIGGIIGGVLGALLLFFIYNAILGQGYPYDKIALYLICGAFAAAATEFGDLVESAIKRKLNIKDMGKLLPGHGGILDRIDGTIYASVLIYFIFVIIQLL